MAGIDRIIARMQGQIAELQRRQNNVVRYGRVIDVDPSKGLVKLDIGDDGSSLETAWVKWAERAGARKTWNPPSVGEVMTLMSPAGEISENSIAMQGGFTDENPPPSSDGDAQAFTLGPLSITVKGSGVTLQLGGITLEIGAAGIAITGGEITHDGTDIGVTHKHDGITPGPAETGTPV